MPHPIKGVLKVVRKEMVNYSDVALKSGATHVGKELANVLRDVNVNQQPVDLVTIRNALKSGIIATGHDLMMIGQKRLDATFSQDQK